MALRPRDLTWLVVMLAGCAGLAGLGDFQDVGTGGASSTDGGASTVGGGGGGTASGSGGSGGTAPEPVCGDGRLDPGEECDHPDSSFCTAGCKVDCNAWSPDASEAANHHCYLVVTTTLLNQPDAAAACDTLGGGTPSIRSTLVGLDSVEERAELPITTDPLWTSGTDQGTEGTFRWTNDDPWVFSPWYAPDNEPDGDANQNCVILEANGSAIGTQDCANTFGYVCELFPPIQHPRCGDGVIQREDDEACDDGNAASGDGCAGCQIECNNGTIDEATGRCYQLRAPDTWNSTLCLGGAYRLVISTTEEMAFLSGVVGRVWTAGHYVQDKFVWQTGEPFIPAVWQGAAPAGQEGDALAFDRGNAALVVEPKSTMHPILCERDAAGRY